jgi:hypothetical protein
MKGFEPKLILHLLGAGAIVTMRMAHDDKFHDRGIEAELPHALSQHPACP